MLLARGQFRQGGEHFQKTGGHGVGRMPRGNENGGVEMNFAAERGKLRVEHALGVGKSEVAHISPLFVPFTAS